MIDRVGIYIGGLKYMFRADFNEKKTIITDLGSFLKVSYHTKLRFAERKAQCIFSECGPLNSLLIYTTTIFQHREPSKLKHLFLRADYFI